MVFTEIAQRFTALEEKQERMQKHILFLGSLVAVMAFVCAWQFMLIGSIAHKPVSGDLELRQEICKF